MKLPSFLPFLAFHFLDNSFITLQQNISWYAKLTYCFLSLYTYINTIHASFQVSHPGLTIHCIIKPNNLYYHHLICSSDIIFVISHTSFYSPPLFLSLHSSSFTPLVPSQISQFITVFLNMYTQNCETKSLLHFLFFVTLPPCIFSFILDHFSFWLLGHSHIVHSFEMAHYFSQFQYILFISHQCFNPSLFGCIFLFHFLLLSLLVFLSPIHPSLPVLTAYFLSSPITVCLFFDSL